MTKSQLREIIREEMGKLDEGVYDALGSVYGAFSSKNTSNTSVKRHNTRYIDELDSISKSEIIPMILKLRRNTISKSNLEKQNLQDLKSYYLEIK